jgi:hypothetical protein
MWVIIIIIIVTAAVAVRRATDYVRYSCMPVAVPDVLQQQTAAISNNKRLDNAIPCNAVLLTARVGTRFIAPTERTAFLVQ